jgi:hypothetical protein
MNFTLLAPTLPERDDPAAVIAQGGFFSRNSAMDPTALFRSVDAFLDLLRERQVPHVLVGGLALMQYVPSRNTQDIDLIMSLPEAAGLPGLVITDANDKFARAQFGPLQVDLLLAAAPLFSHVATNHTAPMKFRHHEIQVATPEGLLLLKLYALPSLYRTNFIDRALLYETDIAMLLRVENVADEQLLSALTPHLIDSDINSLRRDVLASIRERIQRRF